MEDTALRDHFAGLAMQAMVSSYKRVYKDANEGCNEDGVQYDNHEAMTDFLVEPDAIIDIAHTAYDIADAMMAARSDR